MPVSIVVGGQFGSEGKGKVVLDLVRRTPHDQVTVIRVGGPNSGHTGYSLSGERHALRQLPAGAIDRNVDVVFPAGSYLDVDLLFQEIDELDFPEDRIFISPFANIITASHRAWENRAGLIHDIGSTGSGVGAAVMASVARGSQAFPLNAVHAQDVAQINHRIFDTTALLRTKLSQKERVIIEGSQGYGLSLLDGGHWPKATSRGTTAAAALAEAGLSPLDVDRIYMVIRSYPIRVAGESGPLKDEITWDEVKQRCDTTSDLTEYTTVTGRIRRVGEFDLNSVEAAYRANTPTHIIVNHLDYVGSIDHLQDSQSKVSKLLKSIEQRLGQQVRGVGFSPLSHVELDREKKIVIS